MPPAKPAAPAKPDAPAEQDAAAPPARKPRTTKPKAAKPDAAVESAAESPAEPTPEPEAPPSPGPDAEAAEAPAENLVSREQFAKMIGYRPTELVTFERKGWLRPAKREDGISLYNKAEAQEIRQDLRRRLQEEADQTRRNRRY